MRCTDIVLLLQYYTTLNYSSRSAPLSDATRRWHVKCAAYSIRKMSRVHSAAKHIAALLRAQVSACAFFVQ